MLISFTEILNLLIATAVIGYIFSGVLRQDRLSGKRFDLNDFKFAVLVAAPGVVVHELAHKFVAMSFGLKAVFEIFPLGLFIGAFLKFVGSSFILLAPGYVSISSLANPTAMFLTAFSGPLTNLIFWLGSKYYLKETSGMTRKKALGIFVFSEINKWLFIFNMIPVPPLDGSKVFLGLYQILVSG